MLLQQSSKKKKTKKKPSKICSLWKKKASMKELKLRKVSKLSEGSLRRQHLAAGTPSPHLAWTDC